MRQLDKLRKTLRGYYDSHQTPYDHNEWEQAIAYLKLERRKRKIKRMALVLLALLTTVFGLVFYSWEAPTKETNNFLSVSAKILTHPQIGQLPETKSDLIPSKVVYKSQQVAASNPKLDSRTFKMSNTNLVETGIKHSEFKETALPIESHLHAIKTQSATNTDSINSLYKRSNSFDVGLFEVTKNTIEDSVILFGTATNTLFDERAGISEIALAVINTTDKPKEHSLTPDQSVSSVFLSANKDSVSTTNTLEASDTLSESFLTPAILLAEGLCFEAGAVWFYGWKGPENIDARGFSPVIGGNYLNRFSKRWAFSFGVQYFQVRNLSNSSKTSRVSSYRYGEQSQVTVIAPSTMHYLATPLRVMYSMNPNNAMGGGINLAYLLNVDAKVTTYDEYLGISENLKTLTLNGYNQGFSWFDCQFTFLYNRRIAKSFAVQAELFIGLIDVKQDDFFGFTNKERNSGAKLSLVYLLPQKYNK